MFRMCLNEKGTHFQNVLQMGFLAPEYNFVVFSCAILRLQTNVILKGTYWKKPTVVSGAFLNKNPPHDFCRVSNFGLKL